MKRAHDIAAWLTKLGHQDIVPVMVSMACGTESWEGAEYTAVGHYVEGMAAVTRGEKKAGDTFTSRRIYLAGEMPKKHRHGTMYKTGTVYLYGDDVWYLGGYYQENDPRFAEYHPFGPNFGLHKWDLPEPIDKYDSQPAPRRGMTVTRL